jgi:hypothetical protein
MALEACVFDASRECDDGLVEVTLEVADLFTSLDARRENQRDVMAYFPSQCCVGNTCGGGFVPPHRIVGDPTNAVNGSGKRLAGLLRSCLDQRIDHFSVAIVPCESRRATRIVGIGGLFVDSLTTNHGSVWLHGLAYCTACGDGVCADGENCQRDCGGGSPTCY